ncbi:hypothetical protein IAD21_02873 [Abditibacteriota bacterium]|nr:hypothetical protein IAD21_02873 [Abditibacteriota bacterium]
MAKVTTKNENTPPANQQEEECRRPRAYNMGRRQASLDETRSRVLEAARELILGEGPQKAFTMDAVAARAGVARMTVYLRFNSKNGLLEELFDEVGTRGRLMERIPAAFAKPDPLEALRSYIEIFCDFWGDERVLNRRLRGFAALDEEFAATIASRYERRHFAIENLLRRLRANETATPPTTPQELVQTLLALTSFEFYDVFAEERTPAEVAPLIFQLVLSALNLQKAQ